VVEGAVLHHQHDDVLDLLEVLTGRLGGDRVFVGAALRDPRQTQTLGRGLAGADLLLLSQASDGALPHARCARDPTQGVSQLTSDPAKGAQPLTARPGHDPGRRPCRIDGSGFDQPSLGSVPHPPEDLSQGELWVAVARTLQQAGRQSLERGRWRLVDPPEQPEVKRVNRVVGVLAKGVDDLADQGHVPRTLPPVP
jgi:hypothetical protein